MSTKDSLAKLSLKVRGTRVRVRESLLYHSYKRRHFPSPRELGSAHFSTWAEPSHVNRRGFEIALTLAAGRPKVIIETGTSAHGTDSTRLWDSYVKSFGGEFWSVDLSPAPARRLQRQVCPATHLVIADSVEFLRDFAARYPETPIGVCYLDSWDLDWSDPMPAEVHGLREWEAVAPLMVPGSILIVDDTPSDLEWIPAQHREQARQYREAHGYLPGKGSRIVELLDGEARFQKVWHGYNVVYFLKDS